MTSYRITYRPLNGDPVFEKLLEAATERDAYMIAAAIESHATVEHVALEPEPPTP